jgi:uncharacterized protein
MCPANAADTKTGLEISSMTLLSNSRVPVREDLYLGSLDNSAELRLRGSKCADCGEVALGRATICLNCGNERMSELPLGQEGVLHTYTVVRNPPPGDYRGPDPFKPYVMGLVELPEGIQVLSIIDCPAENVRIGMKLGFQPIELRNNADGATPVGFVFASKE